MLTSERQRPVPRPMQFILGVDGFAWKRGQRYGTIVGDLERRRIIDLLAVREAGAVQKWLAATRGRRGLPQPRRLKP